tara:strand:+ start:93 stop:242 length:150 start_codon:yes stop_codon:yes gene_type:complete
MSSKQRFNRALRLAKEQGKANRNKTKSVLNNIFKAGIETQLNNIKQNEK